MRDNQKALREETGRLVSALRAPQVRGRWGEIQLKRVVEMAGMVEHCDFYEQAHVETDDGRLRPDMVVHLPGQKKIVVDAKTPLMAYLEAIESKDDATREEKLLAHGAQVKKHIKQLATKSYWEQFDSTPEFVVLFLPGEVFFSAALNADPSLIEYGAEQRVIMATPTTFISLLRAVAYGWQQQHVAENAKEIAELGKELFRRIGTMAGHFEKVGKSLGQATDAYNKAVGSYEQRVFPAARRFQSLEAVSSEKELPAVSLQDRMPRQLSLGEKDFPEVESSGEDSREDEVNENPFVLEAPPKNLLPS